MSQRLYVIMPASKPPRGTRPAGAPRAASASTAVTRPLPASGSDGAHPPAITVSAIAPRSRTASAGTTGRPAVTG